MTKYNPPRVHLFWLVVILLAAWFLFDSFVLANDHYYRDDDNVEVSTEVVTGDNINSDGSSWGIGAGGPGDVDIDKCWGSTQWGGLTIFKQKLVTIETCLGFEFLSLKKYKLAAMHFCNDKPTLKEFASETECEAEHDFTPSDSGNTDDNRDTEAPELKALVAQTAQYENERQQVREEQQADIDVLMDKFAALERRASRYAAAEREKREYAKAELERLREYAK